MVFIAVLSFLWLAGTMKLVLFWIYLWQLKDYHIGRFLDHFRTAKGKRIIFSYLTQFFVWRLKKPVFTFKTMLLTGLAILMTGGYFMLVISRDYPAWYVFVGLAAYNLLTPLIVSAMVLLIQPLFVLQRTRILQKAAQKLAQFPNLKVIGITGSYGKTSTKEFLATILSAKYNVLATPEHKNSEIGIAQTILQDLNSKHEIFIVEMGAYSKGGIQLLCDMARPQMGIVTGVNEQHLATFGSLENLLSAEGGRELAANLEHGGLLVVNGDNKYCLDLYKSFAGSKKIYTVEKNTVEADIWTEDALAVKDRVSFIALLPGGLEGRANEMVNFSVNVLGGQNVQNLLGAILVAKELGMSLEEISVASKKITSKQAGMTLRGGVHDIDIIDSSYSANPDGVMADLDYLAIFLGKKVIVMSCLIELGQKSAEVHIRIGNKIAEVCDMAIITTKDKFNEIRRGAITGGMAEGQILLCDKPQEIFNMITTCCVAGDAVLLEGGRPTELIKLLDGK